MSEAFSEHVSTEARPIGDGRGLDQRLRHDLRQSLSTVMALVAVIDREATPVRDAIRRLDQVHHEADWMVELLSSGEQEDGIVADVGATVSQTWDAVASCAPCTVRLVREPATLALADPVALRRSVRNLIDNAVRAAGDDGCVEVRVMNREQDVVVEVADSGPGFGRVPTQHGLGLQTVRRFTTRSGGSLDTGSSKLGGTLMTLRLPSAQGATAWSRGESA